VVSFGDPLLERSAGELGSLLATGRPRLSPTLPSAQPKGKKLVEKSGHGDAVTGLKSDMQL
jgi:hypothetical protein